MHTAPGGPGVAAYTYPLCVYAAAIDEDGEPVAAPISIMSTFQWVWQQFNPGPLHPDTAAYGQLNFTQKRQLTEQLCRRLQFLVGRPTLDFAGIAVGVDAHSLVFTDRNNVRVTQTSADLFGPAQHKIGGRLSWADLAFQEHIYAAARQHGKDAAWQKLSAGPIKLGETLCEPRMWPTNPAEAAKAVQALMSDPHDHIGIAAYWHLCQWFARRLQESLPWTTASWEIHSVAPVASVSSQPTRVRCVMQFTGTARGQNQQSTQGSISLTQILKGKPLLLQKSDYVVQELLLRAEKVAVAQRGEDSDTDVDDDDGEAVTEVKAPAPAERSGSPTKRARTTHGSVVTAVSDEEASEPPPRSRARVTPARHQSRVAPPQDDGNVDA